MILFADSGSTKTSWILYDFQTKNKKQFLTLGINPIIHHYQDIVSILSESIGLKNIGKQVQTIYFFGAGCSSIERNLLAKNAMKEFFPNAEIFIDEDMVAAGIAVCGKQEGITCILGTGSNSIYFDGKKWYNSNAGIGFILGDEGSGAYFGKCLLRDFLYEKLPIEIEQELKIKYRLTKDEIFFNVYKNVSPNRYLAKFAPILSAYRQTTYVQQLLNVGFTEFFKYHVTYFKEYKNIPIGFVGSIAIHFKEEIEKVAKEFGVKLGKFMKEPIDEVVIYYTES